MDLDQMIRLLSEADAFVVVVWKDGTPTFFSDVAPVPAKVAMARHLLAHGMHVVAHVPSIKGSAN